MGIEDRGGAGRCWRAGGSGADRIMIGRPPCRPDVEILFAPASLLMCPRTARPGPPWRTCRGVARRGAVVARGGLAVRALNNLSGRGAMRGRTSRVRYPPPRAAPPSGPSAAPPERDAEWPEWASRMSRASDVVWPEAERAPPPKNLAVQKKN